MWAVTVRLTLGFPGWWWWGWVSCSCRPHNCCCTWSCTGWWWTPCPPTTRGNVSMGHEALCQAATVSHRQRAVCEVQSTSFKTMSWICLLRFKARRDESWLLSVFRRVCLLMCFLWSDFCSFESLLLGKASISNIYVMQTFSYRESLTH